MKRLFLIAAGLLFSQSVVLQAQEAPLPKQEPEASAKRSPAPGAKSPPQILPDNVLPAPQTSPAPVRPEIPTIPELDEGFDLPPLNSVAEQRKRHLEWRGLRNRVQNDPEVKEALAGAEKAQTDLIKRKLLRRYYDLYYAKMARLAPVELASYLAGKKKVHLEALAQPRVRPKSASAREPSATESPTPASSASPSLPSDDPILPSLLPSAAPAAEDPLESSP